MTRRLYIKTYGCQMNVYDSRRMADVLAGEGFESVAEPDDADLIILNTCHIREKAAEKVYSDIGRLRPIKDRRAKAGKRTLIGVAGCVAQAEGAEMIRRAPAVDMVFGPQTYHRLPDMVKRAEDAASRGRPPRVMDTDFPAEDKFDFLPEETGAAEAASFVTIQEGCDKFCTFCVVPYTRGAEVSRPVAAVVDEVEGLVDRGTVEVTLLGQNVNAYHGERPDGGQDSLAGLIRRLGAIRGLKRIRYTTSHPRDVDEDLIAVHGEVAACMPYLHLPVQSGSDRILAAMNRRHSADEYRAIVERLRRARPDLALSSDFIVGFPGETGADFEETMKLVREVGFAQAYSFKYSPRPGTPAAAEDDQVPDAVRAERLARLQEELNTQQRRFNEASVGQTMPVLFERPGRKAGQLVGRSPYMQAVHVDLGGAAAKNLDGPDGASYTDHIGRLCDVTITAAGPNSLTGRLAAVAGDRPAA